MGLDTPPVNRNSSEVTLPSSRSRYVQDASDLRNEAVTAVIMLLYATKRRAPTGCTICPGHPIVLLLRPVAGPETLVGRSIVADRTAAGNFTAMVV